MAVTQVMRFSDATTQAVAVTDSVSTTGGFGYNCYGSGLIMVDSVTGSPTLSFFVKSSESAGSSYQLFNSAGTAVTLSVAAGRAYAIPADLAGANYIMVVSSAGTSASVRFIAKG